MTSGIAIAGGYLALIGCFGWRGALAVAAHLALMLVASRRR